MRDRSRMSATPGGWMRDRVVGWVGYVRKRQRAPVTVPSGLGTYAAGRHGTASNVQGEGRGGWGTRPTVPGRSGVSC